MTMWIDGLEVLVGQEKKTDATGKVLHLKCGSLTKKERLEKKFLNELIYIASLVDERIENIEIHLDNKANKIKVHAKPEESKNQTDTSKKPSFGQKELVSTQKSVGRISDIISNNKLVKRLIPHGKHSNLKNTDSSLEVSSNGNNPLDEYAIIADGLSNFQSLNADKDGISPNHSSIKPLQNKVSRIARTSGLDKGSKYSGKHSKDLAQFSFEEFVELPENKIALRYAKSVVSQLGKISPLYFFGDVGVGKTHLLHAVKREFMKVLPENRMRIITPDAFVGEFTRALKAKRDSEFRARYRSLDLLVIDDVQFFSGKEKTQVEFFHLFNAIYSPGKQMLFASDRPPSDLKNIDKRIKSRLASSAIIKMKALEKKSRAKMLDYFAKKEGLSLSEGLSKRMSGYVDGDVRKIQGLIKTILMSDIFAPWVVRRKYHSEKREDFAAEKNTIEVTEEMVDFAQIEEFLLSLSLLRRKTITPMALKQAIEQNFSISPEHWISQRRDKTFKEAFHLYVYMLRKYCNMRVNAIAELLQAQSYSVLYSMKTAEKNVREKKEWKQRIQDVFKLIEELD